MFRRPTTLAGLAVVGVLAGGAAAAASTTTATHRRNQTVTQCQVMAFCICNTKMMAGLVQQGSPKCGYCKGLLINSYCYYCPNVGNSPMHANGYFLCERCAINQSNMHKNNTQTRLRPQSLPGSKQHILRKKIPLNNRNCPLIIKQGWMQKKGEYFTSFRKRWFKLFSNHRMSYCEKPSSEVVKGYCDFAVIESMQKKGKKGFEVKTPKRRWIFLCSSTVDRDDWFRLIQLTCLPKQQPSQASQQQLRQSSQQQQRQQQQQQQQEQRQPMSSILYVPRAQAQVQYHNNNHNMQPGSATTAPMAMCGPGYSEYNQHGYYSNNNNNNNNSNRNSNIAHPAQSLSMTPPGMANAVNPSQNQSRSNMENDSPPPAYAPQPGIE